MRAGRTGRTGRTGIAAMLLQYCVWAAGADGGRSTFFKIRTINRLPLAFYLYICYYKIAS